MDATEKLPGEGFKRAWPPLIKMDDAVKARVEKLFWLVGSNSIRRESQRDRRNVVASRFRHAPGGGRISSPNLLSIPRGMVFSDGHQRTNLGLDVIAPLR